MSANARTSGALVAVLALSAAGAAGARSPTRSVAGQEPLRVFLAPGVTHAVPLEEIRPGGPPVDGIPPIDHPVFSAATQADWLAETDAVLGLAIGGTVKAYPLRILNWHEVVNDTVGGRPVVVTYCPLCRSGLAFDRVVAGSTRTFGVSGLLYQSDLVMYDRETLTLWSQIAGRGLAGRETGVPLTPLPCAAADWGDWRRRHPETLVLSRDTGENRNYDRDPYGGYAASPRLYFPIRHPDDRLPPKTLVLGVRHGGAAKAYPLAILSARGTIRDEVNGARITVTHDAGVVRARIDATGAELPAVTAFWFAWATFHPDTGLLVP